MQENYQNMVMSKKKRGPYSASTMAEKKASESEGSGIGMGNLFFSPLQENGSRIQYMQYTSKTLTLYTFVLSPQKAHRSLDFFGQPTAALR